MMGWGLFIYVNRASQKRMDVIYKKYQKDLAKLDEELGLIKD